MPVWGTGPRRPDGGTNNVINATPTFLLPTQVSSLRLWLDSADISTFVISSVSTVVTWRDKTAFGSHFSTNSGAPQLNFNAGVLFSNTRTDLMISLSSIQIFNGNTTLFAVGRFPTGVTQAGSMIALGGGGVDLALRFNNGSVNQNDIFWQSPNYLNGSVVPWYPTQTTSFIVDGITSNNNFLVNSQFNNSTISLSARILNRFYNGYISEVLIYNYALADFERRGIEAYLARKWGVQNRLPFQHPGRPSQALAGYRLLTYQPVVSNYGLWFDSMDTSTITGFDGNIPPSNLSQVSQWRDKSPNNENVAPFNLAQSPFFNLLSCNYYPAVICPGGNNISLRRTTLANPYIGCNISAFFVVSFPGQSSIPFGMTSTNSGVLVAPATSEFILTYNGASNRVGFFRNNSWNTIASGLNAPLATNTTALVSIFNNGSQNTIGNVLPSTNVIEINGAFVSSTSIFASDSFNLRNFCIFSAPNAQGGSAASFSEIALFYRTLTTPERTAIEGQLIRKWQLPSNAPVTYINSNPVTNGLYLAVDAYNPNFISTTVTSDGLTRVDTAFDRSGNSRNFKVVTGFSNVFYNRVSTMNQFNSLYFSTGATTAGILSNINPVNTFSTNSYSLFMVYNQLSTPVNAARVFAANNQSGADSAVGGFSYQILNNNAPYLTPTDTYQLAGANITIGRNYVYSLINNGGPTFDIYQTSTFYSYHNIGAGAVLTSNINLASTNLLNVSQFNIGGRSLPFSFNGLISEVLLYNRALLSSERTLIENYLLNKWGISNIISNVPVRNGLNLWLDAYDPAAVLTDSNSNVFLWRDKSLCNFHFSNNTTLSLRNPLYTTASNSLPSVFFSSDYSTYTTNLFNNNFIFNSPYDATIFCVAQQSLTRFNNATIITIGLNSEVNFRTPNGFYISCYPGVSGRTSISRSTISLNTNALNTTIPFLNTSVFNSSFATPLIADIPQNNMAVGANGVIRGTSISSFISTIDNAGISSTRFNINSARLGNYSIAGYNQSLTGHIQEILLYNRTLSFVERQQVESYLMSKWNI